MSSNLGQGGDYWGDPMSIVQGASADDLIQAGYGRAAARAPAPAAAPPKCDGNHGGPPCADPECWAKPDELEQIIDGYLEDYELIGEDASGREGSYRPTETERGLIKDAIFGLLAHDEWDAAWGRLINQRAAERTALAAQHPSQSDYEAVLADHKRLVRELDVLFNGEAGAAQQASLVDLVAQVRRYGIRAPRPSQGADEPVAELRAAAQEAVDAMAALNGVKMAFSTSAGIGLAKQRLIHALSACWPG